MVPVMTVVLLAMTVARHVMSLPGAVALATVTLPGPVLETVTHPGLVLAAVMTAREDSEIAVTAVIGTCFFCFVM